MYQIGETVMIKIPVSYQWFLGHVLDSCGDTVKVKTLLKIKNQDVFIVSGSSIKKHYNRKDAAMKGIPSLQKELLKVTRGMK